MAMSKLSSKRSSIASTLPCSVTSRVSATASYQRGTSATASTAPSGKPTPAAKSQPVEALHRTVPSLISWMPGPLSPSFHRRVPGSNRISTTARDSSASALMLQWAKAVELRRKKIRSTRSSGRSSGSANGRTTSCGIHSQPLLICSWTRSRQTLRSTWWRIAKWSSNSSRAASASHSRATVSTSATASAPSVSRARKPRPPTPPPRTARPMPRPPRRSDTSPSTTMKTDATGSPSRRSTSPLGKNRSRAYSATRARSAGGRPMNRGKRFRWRRRSKGVRTWLSAGKRGPPLRGRQQAERPLDRARDEERRVGLQPLQPVAEGLQAQLADVVGGDAAQRLAALLQQDGEQSLVVDGGGGVVGSRTRQPLAVRSVVDQRQHRVPQRRIQQVLEQLAAARPHLGVRVVQAPVDLAEVLAPVAQAHQAEDPLGGMVLLVLEQRGQQVVAGRRAAGVGERALVDDQLPVDEAEGHLERAGQRLVQHAAIEDDLGVVGRDAAEAAQDLEADHAVGLGQQAAEQDRGCVRGGEEADGARQVAAQLVG